MWNPCNTMSCKTPMSEADFIRLHEDDGSCPWMDYEPITMEEVEAATDFETWSYEEQFTLLNRVLRLLDETKAQMEEIGISKADSALFKKCDMLFQKAVEISSKMKEPPSL